MTKPTSPKAFSYRSRIKSKWWKPAKLTCKRYEGYCYYNSMTDTPEPLRNALARYQEGKPQALAKWLADTAGERAAYWAAYDAAQAAQAAAMWRQAA